jgi:hypothetical protein
MDSFCDERPWTPSLPLGVQSFSPEEWVYLSGASVHHFGVRAIPISVYSYELSVMGIAQSLSHETQPFLTYLREDDTIETLTARLILYTGECDWERMALVTPTIRPFILPAEIPRAVDSPETLMDGDEEKIDCG